MQEIYSKYFCGSSTHAMRGGRVIVLYMIVNVVLSFIFLFFCDFVSVLLNAIIQTFFHRSLLKTEANKNVIK